MNKKLKIIAGAIAAVALAVGLYFVNARWIVPATARKVDAAGKHPDAPVFDLTDLTGARLSLADYKGKVVLLDFWATWCGPCREEIPSFVEMQQKYASQGFSVIGVAMQDSPESVNKFYKEFHLNYPVAMGNATVGSLYGGVFGLPTSFVIGRDGRIYAEHTGTTSPSVFESEIKQLLAESPGGDDIGFTPAGLQQEIDVGKPGEVNPYVPGVDVSMLNKTQLAAFEKELDQVKCPCGGCKFSVLQCRRDDSTCGASLKIAREMLQKFLKENDLDGNKT
jgi:thiol-disulfide isomerase/thioredoxin